MTSGIDFNESYKNPFGHSASFYYGKNLRKSCEKLKLKNKSEKHFEYVSGNIQLLGWVLERSPNGKKLTIYLHEKIWTPFEMENAGKWSIDQEENGIKKSFCCLNALARDFKKNSIFYKNFGNWNSKQMISEKWIKKSTQTKNSYDNVEYYQYQWWISNPGENFKAQGILGQNVYVHLKKDLKIVRLEKDYGNVNSQSIFSNIA